MAQPETNTERTSALETLQHQTPHHRRLRPPDLHLITNEEQRIPLKPDTKLSRRESRLGLRGLFGRSKTGKEGDAPASPSQSTRPGGIRASWVDLSSWTSYAGVQPPSRSTTALPTISDSSAPQSPSLTSVATRQKLPSNGAARPPPAKALKSPVASWEPPPLFRAYPQAIRHAHLPACTHSADTILRLSDKRNAQNELDADDDVSAAEKRKKHRRNLSNMLEWTTKIYVLVTSGYLLQYSGDGSFDRLPERILHLGKDSAAFASDVIPGRHWVLQVASVMESNGAATSDSRSLFSRLPFRPNEKRPASNFLMVFESAEDMGAWITILRREIESLGGKKSLSETGKPKPNENASDLKARPSQRTLVVRDPERFSRVMQPHELTWLSDRAATGASVEDAEGSVTVVEADLTPDQTPDQSMDDISTTNSVVSHDGRQLDSLRDSTGANRLSFISSGQRTIITSAGSSPACSPTRDSFASHFEEVPSRDPVPEVRLRPNAAAIADRRQSMQTINPFIDPAAASLVRPHSTYASGPLPDPAMAYGPTTPNFSVPHGVSRRYSLVKTPIPETAALSPPLVPDQPFQSLHPPRVSSRRCPPAGLMLSRPLSIVADQPSPIMELEPPQTPATTNESVSPSQQDATIKVNISPPPPSPLTESVVGSPKPESAVAMLENDAAGLGVNVTPPRKAASMQALRTSIEEAPAQHDSPTPSLPIQTNIEAAEAVRRCRSSMDSYPRSRSRSPSGRAAKQNKRASLQTLSPPMTGKRVARFSFSNASDNSNPPPTISALRAFSQQKHGSLLANAATSAAVNGTQKYPNNRLSVDKSQGVLNRRSTPQLVEGPPPAPPPTCALPPIPQKRVKA
ncbi:hypothetical protein jhhlp_003493 [Lomentospora prolificans]|uniref:PH domain-containing protein n=1 Tax=Lomentospora prolificans TaxID=41688 RepID=A0A2N3N8W9_9PEZI|nr:hypothetical protein jhhlp_003493 [Lomentospora prolificans]